MIITCKTHSGDGTHSSTTFRSEDFHCVSVTLERVKIEILRGNAGHTTPFYTSLSEWQRIEPLLVSGTQTPALPQGLLNLRGAMNSAVKLEFEAGDRRDGAALDYYEEQVNALGRELLKSLNSFLSDEAQS